VLPFAGNRWRSRLACREWTVVSGVAVRDRLAATSISLSLSLSLSLFLSLPRGNRLVEKRNLEFRARVHFVIAETREKAPAKPNASPFIASLLISSLLAFAFSLLLLCLCQAVTAVARQRIDQPFRKCFLSDALQGESSYGVHDGTMDHFAGNQAHCGHRAQYFTRLIN